MIQFALALVIFFPANFAHAAEEEFPRLKIGDITYTNVVVTSKTATDIIILHKHGVASFKLKTLSADLQQKFGFDSKKAEAAEQKRAEAIAEYNAARAQAASNSAAEKVADKQIWAKCFLNQTAPDLIVEKWLSAVPETEGKFVLLFFWITSSEPCQKTIPLLNNLHQKFGNHLVVIGLSDEPEEIASTPQPPSDFFSGIDLHARTRKAVEVRGLPHVLLIDPSGIVCWEGFPLLDEFPLTEEIVERELVKSTQ